MMEQENCTATAEELLKEFGSRNLFMKDATNFLTNEVFVNDMMASYNGVCAGTFTYAPMSLNYLS